MRCSSYKTIDALANAVSRQQRSALRGVPLGNGPFFLVTNSSYQMSEKAILKAIKKLPDGHQLVSVSRSITEQAAIEVEAIGGIVVVASNLRS